MDVQEEDEGGGHLGGGGGREGGAAIAKRVEVGEEKHVDGGRGEGGRFEFQILK